MRTLQLNALIILLLTAVFLSSCRTEDAELINPEQEQNLVANSVLANLMTRTSLNDGSVDNILDSANCFTVQLPITVFVEGLEILVDSEEDFQTIEDVFDDFDGDIATLEIVYPITIILADFSEIIINNDQELQVQAELCNGENENDDDIECIDFQYPLSYSVFNQSNELVDTVTVTNDEEHYAFLSTLTTDDIVSINFPFTLILADDTTITVNNVLDLEDAIEAAIDACDEDDDNDYDDDDCEDCDVDLLLEAFAGCESFEVHKLKRDGENLDDQYEDFTFQFFEDGNIAINDGSTNFDGSWTAEGEGQDITVVINVPEFPVFNDTWNLHEISAYDDEVKVDLRLGQDRLRFKCDQDNDDDDDDDDTVSEILSDGDWVITSLLDNGEENAEIFEGYEFDFDEDGVLEADNGEETEGTWSAVNNDEQLLIFFDADFPLNEISNDFDVISITENRIELQVSGGTEILVFEKE